MRSKSNFIVRLIAATVMVHGLLVIFETLVEQVGLHGRAHVAWHHIFGTTSVLVGLSLIYIGMHLLKRKRTAWAFTLIVYAFLFILSLTRLAVSHQNPYILTATLRDVVIPALLAAALILGRRSFMVRSDIRSFAVSLRISLAILLVTGVYGVVGFSLMDQRDFHREVPLTEAIHRTVDQFDLTTQDQLYPYSRRASVFASSLSVISIGAVAYVLASLFQPLRIRLTPHSFDRESAETLLTHYPASSEDYFKLWPHDKVYFFNGARTAGLAYTVRGGVALVVGDPMGDPGAFSALLTDFDELCHTNDWTVTYVHVEPTHTDLYKGHGFALQKIGEEAVVDLAQFDKKIRRNKYFRQITNKFTKQGYSCEILQPPHDIALIRELHAISEQWLTLPGRSERGFMMGHFTTQYLQDCTLVVLREDQGGACGFLNMITSYNKHEANFDMLRHSKAAPGNSNDFMLMAFIDHVQTEGFTHLNLGLCPLSGLDGKDEERSVIGNALQFLYANGDRFYSFSGLRRFKAKYEPEWQSRYIAYRGGLPGFTRRLNALNRAMRVRHHS